MTSRTPSQVTSDIIAKLAITLPGLSLEVGTPERKLIEACAEAISESQIDNYLVSAQMDIDTKSGQDLEDFVGIFGFGRLQGNYASGVVTFTLDSPATQSILIPVGTQVTKPNSLTGASLIFNTLIATTINVGASVATAAVQCSTIGTDGNVPASTVTGFPAGVGISHCTNADAFTGGTDDESDEELRARFKKTLLRNIAGTEDFYLGLALQANNVSRVNVVGPVKAYNTQIQTGAAATPVTIPSPSARYFWPNGTYVAVNKSSTDPLNPEQWFTETTDYTVTSGALASIALTPTASTANKFLDITLEYCSSYSRNDPANGRTNKVDIFIDGRNPVTISEKIIIKSNTLVSNTSSIYYTGNFAKTNGVTPSTSDKFQRLGSTPIMTWPATIVVGATTYTLGTDYTGAYDITNNSGSEREVSGIIWLTGSPPADNGISTITYVYNNIPQVINALIKRTKQITSDVLVRQAQIKYLSFYFIIMYNLGASVTVVNSNITTALSNYMSSLPFGSWIQLSDMANIIHNVSGVDNCRYAKGADGAPYTVAEMVDGIFTGITYSADFSLADNVVPVLDSVFFIRKSFNSFGS